MKCGFVTWKAHSVGLSGFDIPFHFSAGSEKPEISSPELRLHPAKEGMNIL